MDRERMAAAVAEFLEAAGMDRADPHLADTPLRVAETWADELLAGYGQDPGEILKGFPAAGSGERTVVAVGMGYVSSCPHHLLPYPGVAHLAFIPGEREVGFSDLVRLVEAYGARLVLQEDMAREVAEALMHHLGARGAGVVLDAWQMCMAVRGVRRPRARIRCTAWLGEMASAASPHRRELMDAVEAWHREGGDGARI